MKVTAPLFSLDASGSIGGAIVASKWKGRNYMRRLVTPSNPRSGPQMSNRGMMGFLSQIWASLTGLEQATWQALAAQGNFSPFNAFVRYDLRRWTQFTYPTITVPALGTGTIDDVPVIVGQDGVGQLSGTVTPDAADTDRWAVALYVNEVAGASFAKEDLKIIVPCVANGAYPWVITGLAPGVYYVKGQSFTIGGESAAAGSAGPFTVT